MVIQFQFPLFVTSKSRCNAELWSNRQSNPYNTFASALLVEMRHITEYSPTKTGEYPIIIIIQISYTVRILVFWLVDLYNVTLGCDQTTYRGVIAVV